MRERRECGMRDGGMRDGRRASRAAVPARIPAGPSSRLPRFPDFRIPVTIVKRSAASLNVMPDRMSIRLATGETSKSGVVQLRDPSGQAIALAPPTRPQPGNPVFYNPGALSPGGPPFPPARAPGAPRGREPVGPCPHRGTCPRPGLAAALYGREQGIEVILALIDQPEDEHVRAQLRRLAASGWSCWTPAERRMGSTRSAMRPACRAPKRTAAMAAAVASQPRSVSTLRSSQPWRSSHISAALCAGRCGPTA